jgi:hypothetical protein
MLAFVTCITAVLNADLRSSDPRVLKTTQQEMDMDTHINALMDDELDVVTGGQQLYKHEFPGAVNRMTGLRPFEPPFGPAGSIAQGEINSNQTDNNLP